MNNNRIIKKYPNRRLYDTADSQYITLDDIRNFVLTHTKIQVIDARSGEDITNQILLQVISAQEAGHTPLLTTEILQGIVRFHNNPMQQPVREFLEKSFSYFSGHQEQFIEQMKNFIPKDSPFDQISQLTQKNIDFWQSLFQQPGTNKDKNK